MISFNGADFVADAALQVNIAGFRNEENFSYAVAEATKAFQPNLGVESYRRHVLLWENKWMFLFDDIRVGRAGMRSSGYNHFAWTAHSEPLTHIFSIDGNKVTWHSVGEEKTPLTMFVLDPKQYAWEREIYQSIAGKPMMSALRIVKPEWYNGRMQLLTAWAWEEGVEAPQLVKSDKYLIVLTGNDKAIGFSLTASVPSDFPEPELKGREVFLFGTNPDKADEVLRRKV